MDFHVHVTVHRDKFLIIKPIRCINFSNLFWEETLHVSDSSSVHHQEFFTVHSAMVYVIQVCWQWYMSYRFADNGICHTGLLTMVCHTGLLTMVYVIEVCWQRYVIQVCWQWYMSYRLADSLQAISKPVWHIRTIAVCTVNNSWWWTEELSETCRVSSQNKFEKLVHLVGFIIRNYSMALARCM
jgi:hypothetical protein